MESLNRANMAWENLSFREKTEYIKTAVHNGINTIDGVRDAYHKFETGGDNYDSL